MKKEKVFTYTRFSAEVVKDSVARIHEIASAEQVELKYTMLTVQHDDATWHYDSLDEFLADFRKYKGKANIYLTGGPFLLVFWVQPTYVTVIVQAKSRAEIESIFSIFEAAREVSRIPIPVKVRVPPIVFIGHGHSDLWRELKDHLHEKHGYKVEAYETGARAGHTIRDVLEDMANKASFALLVMTAEDEQRSGNMRARQNVIHEAGLFQGWLGFRRTILLIEEGVEEFSNVHGLQHIYFSRNNIKETFGEIPATLHREFPDG